MNTTIRPQPGRMHSHRFSLLPRVLIGVMLAALVLTLGWGATPSAQAKDAQGPVHIELTALTPSSLGLDDTLTISGTITNVSDQTIGIPQVLLWRSEAPLRTGEDLDAALASDETFPVGSRVTDIPTAYTQDLGDQFAAGATANFTVSAPVNVLSFPESPATYLVGVQMRGVFQGQNQTVGRARTVMPFGEPDPVELTTAIQLDSRPSLGAGRTFSDAHLEEELAPGGRLAELLVAASQPKTTVLVDPALLNEVRAMAESYGVQTPDGIVEGRQQANATAWLDGVEALTTDRWRLPYANPDLVALARHSGGKLLKATRRAGRPTAESAKWPLAIVAADGQLDQGSLKLAKNLQPQAVLLSNAATAPSFFSLDAASSTPLVSVDSGYLAGGPAPLPRDSALQVRQRLLGELQVRGPAAGQTRVLVVDSSVGARAVSALDVPWIERVTLSDALPSDPPAWKGSLEYTEPPAPLSAEQVLDAKRLAEVYETVADLQKDSEDVKFAGAAATARAISSRWRDLGPEAENYVDAALANVRERLNGDDVRLNAESPVVMTGRDGYFPISVTNDLEVGIRAQILFTADNPQRLRIPKITDIEVGPGETVTRNAAPHANSTGTYAIRAQLKTINGEDIGRAKPITVQANNVGKAGWFLVIGAGVIFIGGTVLRIRQVRRGATTHGVGLLIAGREGPDATTEVEQ